MELDREILVSRSPIRYSETLLKETTKITHVEVDLYLQDKESTVFINPHKYCTTVTIFTVISNLCSEISLILKDTFLNFPGFELGNFSV
jgi:hypothetical protein